MMRTGLWSPVQLLDSSDAETGLYAVHMSVPIRFNSQANEQSCDTDNDRSSCGDAQFVGFPPSVLSPSGKMVAVKSY